MKKFEFMTATKVIYEENGLANIATYAKGYGEKAMIVTGKRTTQGEEIKRHLEKAGLQGNVIKLIKPNIRPDSGFHVNQSPVLYFY